MSGIKGLSAKTRIIVNRRPGVAPAAGLLGFNGRKLPCRLGRAGIVALKRESDGATPRGAFALCEVLYRADRVMRPQTSLPCRAIRPDEGWCDQPFDANYNRPVRLPYRGGHERLWRSDGLYDIVVVLDYNFRRRAQNRGSAIFLHLTRDEKPFTAGCVAVSEPDMRRLLGAVGRNAELVIG